MRKWYGARQSFALTQRNGGNMLVLTRKRGESIRILVPSSPEPRIITVHLTDSGNEPRIGFEADRDIEIVRTEILERGPRK
jgi:sRNA-binding carbon storage regulator CsrA